MEGFNGLLSIAVFMPILAAAIIAMFLSGKAAKGFAVATTFVELLITSYIFLIYRKNPGTHGMEDRFSDWIPIESFKVEYFLTVDGISTPLVLLTGILGIVAVFASSWYLRRARKNGQQNRCPRIIVVKPASLQR